MISWFGWVAARRGAAGCKRPTKTKAEMAAPTMFTGVAGLALAASKFLYMMDRLCKFLLDPLLDDPFGN